MNEADQLIEAYGEDRVAKYLNIIGWVAIAVAVALGAFVFLNGVSRLLGNPNVPSGEALNQALRTTFVGLAVMVIGPLQGVVILAMSRGLVYLKATAYLIGDAVYPDEE